MRNVIFGFLLASGFFAFSTLIGSAQEAAPADAPVDAPAVEAPAADTPAPVKKKKEPRRLAPGVMKTIQPFVNYSETYQWASIPSIIAKDASYEWAKSLYFTKSIWCLEFSFKPVRIMTVDFPTESGTMERKNVWYMVYSVTNTGKFFESAVAQKANLAVSVMVRKGEGQIEPEEIEAKLDNIEGTYEPKIVDYIDSKPDENGKIPGTVRFVPRMVLVGQNVNETFLYEKDEQANGLYVSKPNPPDSPVYADQFLPLALAQIAAYEDPNQEFENTVTFPAVDLEPGKTAWGIATWVGVDPRIDKFTVYISGLTNALRWENNQEAFNPDAPPMAGREIFRKVLKINFFRPGDAFEEQDDEFYYGKPGELKFEWVFL